MSGLLSKAQSAVSSAKDAASKVVEQTGNRIPKSMGGSGGTEGRPQILPSIRPSDSGYMLPPYDFAGNLMTPADIGVKRGGDFSDVLNAGKGVIYYTDVIGFGKSTNGLTEGMPFHLLGINFFTRSGMTCTNGAEMWNYFQGIPDGSALGQTVKKAIQRMGYPPMAGLAPGMIEDAKGALNPEPLVRSMFGSVYPVCEKATLPVGDERGFIKDPNSGDVWVNAEDVTYNQGRPYQTRWVQKKDGKGNPIYVSKDEFDKTPKEFNFDGTKYTPPPPSEDFSNMDKASLTVALVLLALSYAIVHK